MGGHLPYCLRAMHLPPNFYMLGHMLISLSLSSIDSGLQSFIFLQRTDFVYFLWVVNESVSGSVAPLCVNISIDLNKEGCNVPEYFLR